MNILEEINTLLSTLNVPIETGVFKSTAPDTYIVLIPLADSFPLRADDKPQTDYQECRITLFSKANYIQTKNNIVRLCLNNDFYITDRRYNGFDTGTGYHQYIIEVAKNYSMEEI